MKLRWFPLPCISLDWLILGCVRLHFLSHQHMSDALELQAILMCILQCVTVELVKAVTVVMPYKEGEEE